MKYSVDAVEEFVVNKVNPKVNTLAQVCMKKWWAGLEIICYLSNSLDLEAIKMSNQIQPPNLYLSGAWKIRDYDTARINFKGELLA